MKIIAFRILFDGFFSNSRIWDGSSGRYTHHRTTHLHLYKIVSTLVGRVVRLEAVTLLWLIFMLVLERTCDLEFGCALSDP